MIWIELIGPSGVGKSYWYEKFISKYPQFEPKQILLNRIYDSAEFSDFPLKIKFMFFVYRLNLNKISNHCKIKLFRIFLNGFQRKSKTIFTSQDDISIEKYLHSIDCLNEPKIIVLKKIAYFNQKLTEFKFFKFYLKKDDVYLAEDGLLHLSPVFIPEMQPDKILIFQKEFEALLEQRLRRARTKPSAFIEFLFNPKDLESYIREYYQLYNSKIKTIYLHFASQTIKSVNLDQEDVLQEMYKFVTKLEK